MIFSKESNFRWEKTKRKYKNKNCIIKYENTIFSNISKIELYGASEIDLQIGIVGILLSYMQRGHTIEEIREIVDKVEENGKEMF